MDPRTIKHIQKFHCATDIPVTYDEAYEIGQLALEGFRGKPRAKVQSVAFLLALHSRAKYAWQKNLRDERIHKDRLPENAAEQIAGICAAIFELDIARSPYGFLQPNVPYAMDNCGMGGDFIVTANASTLAAFIAAADGIPMCKHGSPANAEDRHHGSSDFVTLCGISRERTKQEVEQCLVAHHFAYTEALDCRYKLIHLQTHKFAKLPHMNDIIGPVTNPLHPTLMTRRVMGINHLIAPRIVAKAYRILNERGITHLRHGLFVQGYTDNPEEVGMDEVSICRGGTLVAELRDEEILEYRLFAKDFGLQVVEPVAISPPQGMSKGELSLKILSGEIAGPVLEMILANAAILFYLAGRSNNLRECYQMAAEIHGAGRDYEKMIAVQAALPLTPKEKRVAKRLRRLLAR